MEKFGLIKSKILKKLTDSFSDENKLEIKSILTHIKENKNIKEMYLLYEEIENKYIDDREIAKLYVEELSNMLKTNKLELKNIESLVSNIEINEHDVYSLLDTLCESDSLLNLEKKVLAKKKLVDHLTTKKEPIINESTTYTENENLLHAVLVNNFNLIYNNNLTENEKKELKDILSMSFNETESKINELKENIEEKIQLIISESNNDTDLIGKLNQVRNEMKNMDITKYNYYRLTQLKNGL